MNYWKLLGVCLFLSRLQHEKKLRYTIMAIIQLWLKKYHKCWMTRVYIKIGAQLNLILTMSMKSNQSLEAYKLKTLQSIFEQRRRSWHLKFLSVFHHTIYWSRLLVLHKSKRRNTKTSICHKIGKCQSVKSAKELANIKNLIMSGL